MHLDMNPLAQIDLKRQGPMIQWFGDVIQHMARAVGLPPHHCVGIASFLTEETVMLLMQEWADKHSSIGVGDPHLPSCDELYLHLYGEHGHERSRTDHGQLDYLSDEDGADSHLRNDTPQQGARRLLTEYYREIIGFDSNPFVAWTWRDLDDPATPLPGRDAHRHADAVFLRALALYWFTYAHHANGLADVCPTMGAQSFGDWVPYDPAGTFQYHMEVVRIATRGVGGVVVERPLDEVVDELIDGMFSIKIYN